MFSYEYPLLISFSKVVITFDSPAGPKAAKVLLFMHKTKLQGKEITKGPNDSDISVSVLAAETVNVILKKIPQNLGNEEALRGIFPAELANTIKFDVGTDRFGYTFILLDTSYLFTACF